MTDLATAIDTYLAACAEPDKAVRRRAVERVWAPQGRLVDPPLAAHGHAQIVDLADALLSLFPGHRFRRSSGIDGHHGCARYAWQLVDADGEVALEGCDFAELDDDGMIRRVTRFFGPLPQREAA